MYEADGYESVVGLIKAREKKAETSQCSFQGMLEKLIYFTIPVVKLRGSTCTHPEHRS